MDAVTTRLPAWLQGTIERVAPGQRRSDAIRQLVLEAATEREFPMVIWRDGPSGRRPGLRGGPDVEEVVLVARLHPSAAGPGEIAAEMGISEAAVADALRFAEVYAEVVDPRVAMRERAGAVGPTS